MLTLVLLGVWMTDLTAGFNIYLPQKSVSDPWGPGRGRTWAMQPWRQELRELIRSVETACLWKPLGLPCRRKSPAWSCYVPKTWQRSFRRQGQGNRTAMTRITSLRGRLGLTS